MHPKDPFKRVDVLPSGRKVTVKVGGQTVADSGSSGGGVMMLVETGLRARWYLPADCVDYGVLRTSETRSFCPYKGEAE